jgi:Transcriptional regulatory protein, C terminal
MTASGTPLPALAFGPYRLEGPDGLLRRGPRVVALSFKAVAVLWCLARQAGELVRKADLFAAVWPATAVTEGVLTGCVRELRRALGDDAQRPCYIEPCIGVAIASSHPSPQLLTSPTLPRGARDRKERTGRGPYATRTIPDPQIEAEACFYQALAVARCQQAKSLELQAAMSRL